MSDAIVIEDDIRNISGEELAGLYSAAFGRDPEPDKIGAAFENCITSSMAWSGDRLVGAVYAISDGAFDATIHALAVHPDFQGQGIATRLMEHILAKLEGVSILLTTDVDHVHYNRRWGFRRQLATMALRYPEDETE